MSDPVLLAARGVTKRYGSLVALSEAHLELRAGDVHAVVGENGAGKSTLAKILAGLITPESGVVERRGEPITFSRRRDAIAAGVGLVPQQLSLVGALTVLENYMLASPKRRLAVGEARSKVANAATQLGLEISLDTPAMHLSLPERQLGELVVAVAQGADVLLLDEPTSSLGPADIERLIRCVRQLASDGVAVGLVTHRITEVLEGADHVTVLREGRMVHQGPTAGLDADRIATLMVGERSRVSTRPPRQASADAPVRLHATAITVNDDDRRILDDIELTVRSGEVVGIAGVAGSGQTVLADVLTGVRAPDRGTVEVDGTDVTGAAARATRAGVAFIPEERTLGVAAEQSIAVNASALRMRESAFARWGMRRRRAETEHGLALAAQYDVRPPKPSLLTAALSGGNQQKLLVGRELEREPAVVIAHGPTQGLDLAAASSIRNHLTAAAQRGAAVVVISADLDELLELADRVVVLSSGRVTDDIALHDHDHSPIDVARLGRAMAHVSREES
ncbi:MAG: hypothetical protein RL219_1667 [Actinomycetota bacterium]|jgi:ABC-type uncharacterized transport system ATPase subunit